MWRTVCSAIQFQIAWPVCVLVGSPLIVAAFTVANLWLHTFYVANLPRESGWLVSAWSAGALLDLAVFRSGLLINSDGSIWPPFWLLCLWLNFALAVRYCFAFLQKNLLLASALGAVAGPFSYFVGSALNGQVSLMQPPAQTLIALALIWAVFLPFLVRLARLFDTVEARQNA